MFGEIIENQIEAARIAETTYKLYPSWHQAEIEKMGFSRGNNATAAAAGTAVPALQRKSIPAAGTKTFWYKPSFGLFKSQTKWLPTS